MNLGRRNSRKIVCRYDITGRDVCNQASYEDSSGFFPWFIDGYGVMTLPTVRCYLQIPYEVLGPKGSEKLLVLGVALLATIFPRLHCAT